MFWWLLCLPFPFPCFLKSLLTYNLHTTKSTYFSIHLVNIQLCSHHHSKSSLLPHLPSIPTTTFWQLLICFVFMDWPFLDIHINGIIWHVAFCIWVFFFFLTWHNIFEGHPFWNSLSIICFLLLYGGIIMMTVYLEKEKDFTFRKLKIKTQKTKGLLVPSIS